MEAIRLNNYNMKPMTYNIKPKGIVKLNVLANKIKQNKIRCKSAQGYKAIQTKLPINFKKININKSLVSYKFDANKLMRVSMKTFRGVKEYLSNKSEIKSNRSYVSADSSRSAVESNLSRL